MTRPYFSRSARDDLVNILEFISADKPGAAVQHVERLEDAGWSLARNPELGIACDDLLPRLRIWSIDKYAIFYRPTIDGIEVVRVVHGSRDFPALFK